MMNKTTGSVYRIFLSSTAIDMVEHRKKVIDAILRLGDLPVAMETFGALPNEPVEVCKNKVRESNALVVMVAHRYGWVPGPGEGGDGVKSITRIEVDTAVEEGIPVFADRSGHADCCYAWGEANALHLCGICHKELKEPELARKRLVDALKIRKRIQHPEAAETEKILKEL